MHDEGHFTGAGGLELLWQCWLPDGEAPGGGPHREGMYGMM